VAARHKAKLGLRLFRLGEVPVLNLSKKSPPKKSFTEAVAIAEQFLRGQKIDLVQRRAASG